MHKFLRTMTAAAVAAAMAPAFAADATYNVDVVVVGAGAAGTAAGWAAAEKGLKVVTLEKQAMVGGLASSPKASSPSRAPCSATGTTDSQRTRPSRRS